MAKAGHILIVEDEQVSLAILKKLFIDEYEISEATNGKAALEIIQKNMDKLSAIILDLYMPELNGYDVLKAISGNGKWKEIPVVITTSERFIESDKKLLDLGAFTVIHKPINAGIIKRQVSNIIERQKKYKHFVSDYVLQDTLIRKTANTFSCMYHFEDDKIVIGKEYLDFFEEDFEKIFKVYPFRIEEIVLPKKLVEAMEFFDIKNKERLYDEIELRLKVGVARYEWFKIAVMIQCDEDNQRNNAFFLFTNIEYEIEAKENLTFLAMNDVLTRIPNLHTFTDQVKQLLEENPEEDFTMISMDLQQFRMVNKLFGYSEGDAVLRYVATKLQETIEAYDKGTYCRMSSDIFHAFFSTKEDLEQFLDVMQAGVKNYPLKYEMKLYFGIYTPVQREESVESIIEHASYSLAEAKKNPLLNIQYYTEELSKKEYFEALVVAEMEQALKEKQFEVYYQPKCNLVEGRVIGAEALIRWNAPKSGFLSPGIFIPIFEKNGFVTELDYYVYDSVCSKIREWIDNGITPVPVSVNVSRCSLYAPELLERTLEIVAKYEIPHEYIEFEITESAFILEKPLLLNFTEGLRKEGFRVLIDDFGSGYSSLNSLKNMEVDELKIDIAFLPVSLSEVKSPVILEAVIDMAKRLGLETIAEGVETAEQITLLKSLGCERVQGYYFYRPMKVLEYEEILRKQG